MRISVRKFTQKSGVSVQLLCTEISSLPPLNAFLRVNWCQLKQLWWCVWSIAPPVNQVLLHLSAENRRQICVFVLPPKSAVQSSRQTRRILLYITTSLVIWLFLVQCQASLQPTTSPTSFLASILKSHSRVVRAVTPVQSFAFPTRTFELGYIFANKLPPTTHS